MSKTISGNNTDRKRVNKRKRIQDNFNEIVVVEAEIHVRNQNASVNRQDNRNIGKLKDNEGKVTQEKNEKEQNNYERIQPRGFKITLLKQQQQKQKFMRGTKMHLKTDKIVEIQENQKLMKEK